MKRLLILVLGFTTAGLSAQTVENIQMLNTFGLHGTPRYVAMGGAFTALGADMSAIHLNPAASSVYRNDNFEFSLGIQGQNNDLSFLNHNSTSNNINVLIENIGLVKKFGGKDNPIAFSIGYNKLADFNTDYTITGTNNYNPGNAVAGYTLGEYWLAGAQGQTYDQLINAGLYEEAAALDATVLYHDSGSNVAQFYDYYPDNSSDVRYHYNEAGSFSEALMTLSGRINDQFHLGFGVGFPSLSYSNSTSLTESGFADSSFFTSYTLHRDNQVYANGVNLKFGVILKPTQALRIGLSYQSPSWMRASEVYRVAVDGITYNNDIYQSGDVVLDNIDYSVKTPSIYRAGLAVVFGKQGLISFDYEYSNPNKTQITAKDGNDYSGDEQTYAVLTKAGSTFKIGGEYRIKSFYLRAGYQYRSTNFNNPDSYYSSRNTIGFGGGFKNENFGVDIGYSLSHYSRTYFVHPYLGDNLDGNGIVDPDRTLANNDISKGNFLVGVNFNF